MRKKPTILYGEFVRVSNDSDYYNVLTWVFTFLFIFTTVFLISTVDYYETGLDNLCKQSNPDSYDGYIYSVEEPVLTNTTVRLQRIPTTIQTYHLGCRIEKHKEPDTYTEKLI